MYYPVITLYTDGSFRPMQNTGAAATMIDFGPGLYPVILKYQEYRTTNNRMELIAILQGLDYIRMYNLQASEIRIVADSKYALDVMKRYAHKVMRHPSTTVPNIDLIRFLYWYINNPAYHLTYFHQHAHLKKITTLDALGNDIVDKCSNRWSDINNFATM